MAQKNDDPIKRLGEKLREMAEEAAKRKAKPLTMEQLAIEGDKLLAEENKTVKKKPVLKDVPPPNKPSNPYAIARETVLKKFPKWKRSEIATMEQTGNLDNQHYNEFVKQVAEEGDKLSR